MAFVLYFDSSGNPLFSCSGTLVSSNVVLTAGHCAADESTAVPLSPSGYRVVTGAVDWTDAADRTVSAVKRVVVNPAFDPAGPVHDAALLVLSAPVSQKPIALWGTGQLPGGTGAWIAGWGDTYGGQNTVTTALQFASTVVQSSSACAQPILSNYVFDPGSELCALNYPSEHTGTCSGDSGGPLWTADSAGRPIEVGVTSVGPADCDTQTPDFFTSVLPIKPWIESWISNGGPVAPAANSITITAPSHATAHHAYSIRVTGHANTTERLYVFLDYRGCARTPAGEHNRANGYLWTVQGAFSKTSQGKSPQAGQNHVCAYLAKNSEPKNSPNGVLAQAFKSFRVYSY
jgi:trypsin